MPSSDHNPTAGISNGKNLAVENSLSRRSLQPLQVGIGTPPRTLHLLMDTGSDIIWTQCPPCDPCFEQPDPIFQPTQSSTYYAFDCAEDPCKYFSPRMRRALGQAPRHPTGNVRSFGPDPLKRLIIDSGTVYSSLPTVAYNVVKSSLEESIHHLGESEDPNKLLDLCYTVTDEEDFAQIPSVTFHFAENADWVAKPEALFDAVDDEYTVYCLGMLSTRGTSTPIFGGLFQRDMFVEYDLQQQNLFFAPTNCVGM
ncbi:hypothetical protein AMTR_s00057p00163750 [Amborella trichopoda]|uniref:Peptidase A1 domain-containing protein n=1 Tax=Amborella trichopoda TaxID=13333 RepID=U5D634_AMBTC|nr:hypothetical protein AMTR_s00057p00163750 [Amborella trichopoda]